MPVKMRRRRVKKRKRPGEISKVKFIVFIAIMILAVFLGYLTARFVIGPLLGYDADESPIKITGQEGSSDDEESKETGSESDSDENQTEEAEEGYAKVIEDGEMFKVISPVLKTKDEAIQKLDDIKDKEVEDVFIASF